MLASSLAGEVSMLTVLLCSLDVTLCSFALECLQLRNHPSTLTELSVLLSLARPQPRSACTQGTVTCTALTPAPCTCLWMELLPHLITKAGKSLHV